MLLDKIPTLEESYKEWVSKRSQYDWVNVIDMGSGELQFYNTIVQRPHTLLEKFVELLGVSVNRDHAITGSIVDTNLFKLTRYNKDLRAAFIGPTDLTPIMVYSLQIRGLTLSWGQTKSICKLLSVPRCPTVWKGELKDLDIKSISEDTKYCIRVDNSSDSFRLYV